MSVADYLYAHLIALFISGILIVACLRSAAAEMPLLSGSASKFSVLEDIEFSGFQNRVSSYVFIILTGLLLVTVSSRPKKQILVPDIPIVGGSDSQHVKENRRRFIHDGKSMIEDGYQQVG